MAHSLSVRLILGLVLLVDFGLLLLAEPLITLVLLSLPVLDHQGVEQVCLGDVTIVSGVRNGFTLHQLKSVFVTLSF